MEQEVIEKALRNVTRQALDGTGDGSVEDDGALIRAMKQTVLNFLERGDEDMTFAIRFVDELIEEFNS